jgi:23S rRNA (uracil1939-C5)-methyltransferase
MGLAHAEGRTIFVALAAPGDQLRVRIDRQRGRLAFASVVEILKPSSVRVDPPCPYFGHCGGCDFQQLKYEAQLDAKKEIVLDCLRRIARIDQPPEISIVPSPRAWHYRARANWQIETANRKVGYFERGTHQVCDVAECGVLIPELEQALEAVRAQIEVDPGITAEEIEAVAGDDGVSLAPPVAGFETKDITRKIGNETYRFSARSFFQINHDLLESLVAYALSTAEGHSAVDLYSGVGLFTVPLARRFTEVVGVESNPNAAEYARQNSKRAGLENARVITARVSEWLREPEMKATDFLLLDPPRTGVESTAIPGIVELNARRITYVSCDPATLARDLKELLGHDYVIDAIRAFDMFPQTHHVEAVVHLKTKN